RSTACTSTFVLRSANLVLDESLPYAPNTPSKPFSSAVISETAFTFRIFSAKDRSRQTLRSSLSPPIVVDPPIQRQTCFFRGRIVRITDRHDQDHKLTG